MKQALVEGAVPIPGIPMYEQGQGKLNLLNSMQILQTYKPKASIVPAGLDFTDCPFMWPFCTQPLYAHALSLIFNATVLNAMGLTGQSRVGLCPLPFLLPDPSSQSRWTQPSAPLAKISVYHFGQKCGAHQILQIHKVLLCL